MKLVFTLTILLLFLFTGLSQTTLISSAGDGGFETGTTLALNGWTSNGATNLWEIGNAPAGQTGARCAYISNTGAGGLWTYTNSSSKTSHLYRSINFPPGETTITLSFKWKCNGESGFDRLLVYTNATPPVSGTPASSGTAWGTAVLVGGPYNSQTTWQTANITLPAALAGTTSNLMFTWQNDGSLGSNGPAAVDDILLISNPPPPPPSNDLCANATSLPCGTTNLAGTTVNTTSVTHGTGCSMGNYGVWYTFVGDGVSTTISSTAGAGFDHEMAIASGSCGSLANVICRDLAGSGGTESYTFTPTNAVTYYVYISYYGSSGTSANTGTFTITRQCASPPPANNLICNATSVTVNPNLSCASVTSGTVLGATGSGPAACDGTADDDVWFKFVATSTIHTFDLLNIAGSTSDLTYELYSGTCGSPTYQLCYPLNSYTTFGFTIGNTYFVRVYTYTATGYQTSTFDFCIGTPSVPVNDLCANATSLPCGTTNLAGSTVATSNVAHGTGCTMSNYGVWYTFIGDGQSTTISTNPQSGFDIEMAIDTGSCGSLTNVICKDATGSGNLEGHTFTTIVGTRYYVYIAYINSGSSASYSGSFTISRTCSSTPPQDCLGGTSICSDVSFSGNSLGTGSVVDINVTNQGCLSIEHQASWYFFEANSGGTLEFGIKPINGTDDYDFALWGPYSPGSTPAAICPPSGAPIRCSFAAGAPPAGGTGLQYPAVDFSEGTGGDDIVAPLDVLTGEVYILLIDNYTGSSSPFDMDLNLTNGLNLNCNSLPIELLSFNGFAEEGFNKLKWTTVVEVNNDFFEIEKSSNGVLFTSIAKVDGAGNSSLKNNYEFIDKNPYNGVTYYRFKQVDYNGTMSYSNVVAVKQSPGASVAIFPNPTFGRLKLNFVSKDDEIYRVVVSDIFKTINETSFNINRGNHVVDMDYFIGLSKGFYIVQIFDKNDNIIITERVIKY